MRQSLITLLILASFVSSPLADEVRYYSDDQFPRDTISVADFRNQLRGIDQMDIGALKPAANLFLDEMEWSTNASAQAQYSGTGVTITSDSAVEQEGTYNLKAVTDGTSNREFGRTLSVNLSAFTSITLWERSSQTSDTIQFYLEDSGGDQSYWDLTTNASADTYQQDTITLASPDSNSGTAADLSDIVEYGWRQLTASKTYYFDTTKGIVAMTVVVRGSSLGEYYESVRFNGEPLDVDMQAAPTLTAPTTNPRIDILTINSSGTLAWVAGTEASTPSAPWSSVGFDVIPIAEVYMKTTMTKVLDFEDKDTDSNQGYILKDVRPFISLNTAMTKGADVASASSMTLGNDGNFFDITGTTGITSITAKPSGTVVWLQFDSSLTVTDGSNLKLNGNFISISESVLTLVSDGTNWHEVSRQPTAGDFLSLSDTPASFSSQSLRHVRVNAGETALEFIANPFDTTSGHDHDGSDAKKVVITNLDPTGVTDGYFLKRSGSSIAGSTIPYNSGFGSWVDLGTSESATQATSDGFLSCYADVTASGGATVSCITDVNASPTTVRNKDGNAGTNSVDWASCSTLFKKDDYFKCDYAGSTASTQGYYILIN